MVPCQGLFSVRRRKYIAGEFVGKVQLLLQVGIPPSASGVVAGSFPALPTTLNHSHKGQQSL